MDEQLALALQRLDAILKPGLTEEALNGALVEVFERAKQADPASRDRALAYLAERVATIPLGPASFLAVGCGALVELGANPEPALPAILARTREALAGATVFAEACQAQARSGPPGDLDSDDAEACIEAFGQQVGDRMPEQADAWLAAADLLRSMTALLSHSASARATARADQELAAALERMLDLADPGCAGFARQLLHVLDGEELVVLHPGLGRGYRVRISGVADNVQLDVLLAAALIGEPEQGWLPGTRPDPQVAAAARDGPVGDSLPPAIRTFKLVNWHGLRPDGTLAEGTDDHEHWIWSEGVPADIATLDGQRIVLVGPSAYPGASTAGRRFPGMVGDLRVVETLTPEAARALLQRIAAAAGSAPPAGDAPVVT
jgi:hypothetical protein